MLKPVGLHRKNARQIFFRESSMKGRQVVAGICIGGCTGVLQFVLIALRGEFRRAAKHQVLEEMREAALARLDLIAGTCSDDDKERNDIRIISRNRDQPKAVGQIVLDVWIREDFVGSEERSGREDSEELGFPEVHSVPSLGQASPDEDQRMYIPPFTSSTCPVM